MMDVSNPIADVVPSAHGPVLAVLASTSTPLTGRAIAELTRPRVSQPRVARILADLTEAGLVDRIQAGSASLFTLNREHLAARAVEDLATLRTRLWERIAEHAAEWTYPPEAIVVYGSTARGDGGTASDVDLLVVRPAAVDEDDPDWQRKLTALGFAVPRWTGNPCEILDRSREELRAMASAGERLLSEIRRDGRAIVGSMSLVPAPQAA
ncbi:nucleotidyltransferase domain-containing protein [Actinotalea subterranea]|uniref:nucleotidyltransferase domain-containing protein n=1 Tax=Actinotalea subterranea TaxID=2607497 RepID=UPI0011EC6E11|nr:nucleotidyltransferase domain-containing protein [Actinotalea subterranea]